MQSDGGNDALRAGDMTWYLKIAFGQSETSFGGTGWDPSMGLDQGNGTAPPGFLVVCTLMINVYRNLGHGVRFVGAWTLDTGCLHTSSCFVCQ